jgi:hypothetical protein
MGATYPKPKLNAVFRTLNTTVDGEVAKWEVLGWIKNEPMFKKVQLEKNTRELLRRVDLLESKTVGRKQLQNIFTGWFEEEVDLVVGSLIEKGRLEVRGQQPTQDSPEGDRFAQYRVIQRLWELLDTKKVGLITSDTVADKMLKDPSRLGHQGFLLHARLGKLHQKRIDFSAFTEYLSSWAQSDLEMVLLDLEAVVPKQRELDKKQTSWMPEEGPSGPVYVRPPVKAWDTFIAHRRQERAAALKETNEKTSAAWHSMREIKAREEFQLMQYKQRQREARQDMELQLRREMMATKHAEAEAAKEEARKRQKREKLVSITKKARDRNRDEQCTDAMRSMYQQALRLVLLGPVTPQEEQMLEELRETHHISDTMHTELYQQILSQIQQNQLNE